EGFITDITERREAERKIGESGAILKSIIESTSDSVFALDREYRYIACNSNHQRMIHALYGSGPVHAGRHLSSCMTNPSHAASMIKLVDRALQGEQFIYEFPYPANSSQQIDYKELT